MRYWTYSRNGTVSPNAFSGFIDPFQIKLDQDWDFKGEPVRLLDGDIFIGCVLLPEIQTSVDTLRALCGKGIELQEISMTGGILVNGICIINLA